MWFWLALASAIFGAIDIILSKYILRKVSPAVLSLAAFGLSLPILLYMVISSGLPGLSFMFFYGALGSSLAYVFSKTLINDSLKQNSVSKIFPLSAFSGIFTYVFALVFLSESIRLIPVIGLAAILLGSYILNADQAKEDILKPVKILFTSKASIVFLVAILLSSITSIFDKTAIENTKPASPLFTLFIEQLVMSIMLTMYLIKKERRTWITEFKNSFWLLFLDSMVFLIIGLLVFNSYLGGPVALVLGVKRLQIFFILLMGYIFFKDKPTKHAWIATAIMLLGVILIRIG